MIYRQFETLNKKTTKSGKRWVKDVRRQSPKAAGGQASGRCRSKSQVTSAHLSAELNSATQRVTIAGQELVRGELLPTVGGNAN